MVNGTWNRGERAGEESVEVAPGDLFAGYIFDLDGTIYLGEAPLPGARRLIAALRALDRSILFVTNNPTKSRADYAVKLTAMGIPTTPEQVLGTVQTMTDWLLRTSPEATLFAIGEEPLIRALTAAGFRLSGDPAEIDIVIASYDRSFDYRKLQIAFDAIWYHKRARLVATNPDRFCPFPGGRGEPDAAAIVAAIEACTGATCELHTGKPSPLMLETALRLLDLAPHQCLMTGDRLSTDIRMAHAAGMPSAVVLSGETTPAILRDADERPDYVLNRIDRLIPLAIRSTLGWTDTVD